MDAFRNDLGYSLRMLGRTPGFTAMAVLVLALGIGMNTLIFDATSALLDNPLPVRNADSLVEVFTTDPSVAIPGFDLFPVSQPNLEDFERESHGVLTGLAGYTPAPFVLSGREKPERIAGYLTTANYFDVLGVRTQLGRGFQAGEDRIGAGAPVAVISHALWLRRFGGDPSAVGRPITLNGHPYTLVGVAPPGFRGTVSLVSAEQIWTPLASYGQVLRGTMRTAYLLRRALFLNAVGRLAPGVSRQRAEATLSTVARRLEEEYPNDNKSRGVTVRALTDSAVGTNAFMAPSETSRAHRGSAAVTAVAGIVLLIGCANLSSLLVVRFARRGRETAIRAALGANPRRLALQPLLESALICAGGGAAGWALATRGRPLLRWLSPPFLAEKFVGAPPSGRAFLFALAIASLVSLLMAALPAIMTAKASPVGGLNASGRQGALSRNQRKATRVLVVAEMTLAAVAIVGSGLFLRALSNAQRIETGLRSHGMAYFTTDLSSAGYEGERAQALCRRIVEDFRALPGVAGAAVSTIPPIGGGPFRTVIPEGTKEDPSRFGPAVLVDGVSSGYLATAGISLLRGRDLQASDRADTAPVAVVTEAFVARYWPGQDPLGRRFRFLGDTTPVLVVGVVRNAMTARLGEPPQPVAYVPLAQVPVEVVSVTAYGEGDSARMLEALLARLPGIDPGLAASDASTVEDALARELWAPRSIASLLAGFAGLALCLAAIGIYGLVSQSLAQRTQEMGIRIALGATPASIRRLVLGEGMRLAALGALLGIAFGAALARTLTGLLFGVAPADPSTFLGACVLLTAATAAACLIPVQRVLRLHPVAALRGD